LLQETQAIGKNSAYKVAIYITINLASCCWPTILVYRPTQTQAFSRPCWNAGKNHSKT